MLSNAVISKFYNISGYLCLYCLVNKYTLNHCHKTTIVVDVFTLLMYNSQQLHCDKNKRPYRELSSIQSVLNKNFY